MKTPLYFASLALLLALPFALLLALLFAACSNPVLGGDPAAALPSVPPEWEAVLGAPSWKIERYGDWPAVWPAAVSAWPYWPQVPPGLFKPAGAVMPRDAGPSGATVRLSWKGGAEAAFYRALEAAWNEAAAGGENPDPKRQARFFNWARFQGLLDGDPWLIDWKTAAQKTVASGFRASYLVKAARVSVSLTAPAGGPWINGSPFRPAEAWAAGEEIVLELGEEAEVWACPEGLWFLSKNAQIWRPF